MFVYLNNRIVPKTKAWISPDDRGFVLGDGVYDVVRSYGGKLFRLKDHFQRLERSLQEIRLQDVDFENLGEIVRKILEKNRLRRTDALVYIQITRGVAPRKHAFPPDQTRPTVYVSAESFRPYVREMEEGVKAILVPDLRWGRCDIKTIGLLANVLACQKARESGAYEAVFARDHVITEGSHTNVAAVFDGSVVTHPEGPRILPSITRAVVKEICRESGIPFHETPIGVDDFRRASEILLLGTSTEVVAVVRVKNLCFNNIEAGPPVQVNKIVSYNTETGPVVRVTNLCFNDTKIGPVVRVIDEQFNNTETGPVVRVDDWTVGNGKPGPMVRRLQEAFRKKVEQG